MLLILHGLPPLHWALAGVGIAGVTLALLALAGALVGAALLGSLYPALQRPLALPPLMNGTGEG